MFVAGARVLASAISAAVLSEVKKPKADAEEVNVREGLAPGSLDV